MLPVLLSAALAAAPCTADLSLANPRLKVVRGDARGFDHQIVTVDVTNRGSGPQLAGIRQRLELVRDGAVLGAQAIPPLGADGRYVASFRLRVGHERTHHAAPMTFRYVLDARESAPRNNCDASNDLLTARL